MLALQNTGFPMFISKIELTRRLAPTVGFEFYLDNLGKKPNMHAFSQNLYL